MDAEISEWWLYWYGVFEPLVGQFETFLTISGTETKMVIKYYDYDDIDVEQTM